ncbi:MAG: hypothetical protein DLM53_10085 [Candidatus Eremiobacter antarcticus]|nr:GNAT family N-acetyltransferase [Candidatus Eremiobacteraeota bacterium]MBC5807183.1 GNAT family N-acetyltransferase [Candidatus Eremiobacteraeota bacterium]PZR60992.1 MAG: hypothetical protein DLM53_10085 [Candidatus Eremiobacter sp. RRmetagenome_bin22]
MAGKLSKPGSARRAAARGTAAGALVLTWLQSEHAGLRPIEPADVPFIRGWLKQPPVSLWPWPAGHKSEESDIDRYARLAVDRNSPALIIENRAYRPRGLIVLRMDGIRATLGIAAAGAHFWREICAAESIDLTVSAAFRIWPLQRIELLIFAGCQAALACARKAGFRHEGVLRCCRRTETSFEDCVVLSIVRA